jgi:hypothetical protein
VVDYIIIHLDTDSAYDWGRDQDVEGVKIRVLSYVEVHKLHHAVGFGIKTPCAATNDCNIVSGVKISTGDKYMRANYTNVLMIPINIEDRRA